MKRWFWKVGVEVVGRMRGFEGMVEGIVNVVFGRVRIG